NISRPNTIKNKRIISIDGLYSLFEARRDPEFYFDGETHSAWEMVYICDGSVGVTSGDKVYKLTSGDVIFHSPMQFHKIWSEDGGSPRVFITSFYLDGELAHKLKDGVFRLNDRQSRLIEIIISNLRKHFNVNPDDIDETNYASRFRRKNEALVQLTMTLLEAFMTDLALSDDRNIPASTGENEQLYTKIAGILEEHVNSSITIPEIAQICNVSSATVKNCFSAFAGCGVHKYLLTIKMRSAAELLKSGKTVSEVSDILGFANPNYFSYVFKREMGKTASSCRK
ncbi:MAG: AraC family transcriptional regulator, partial [Clostridia bacterium]|nr:AraC family transcriptional regulator [Clostridia bacterium]